MTNAQQIINLKQIVLEKRQQQTSQNWPIHLTEQERDDFEQKAFVTRLHSFYFKRQAHFDRLNAHAKSDDSPLVIVGESGSGKSALLANWALEYQQAHPDERVLSYFCGNTEANRDPIVLLRRVMKDLKNHCQIEDHLPNTTEAIIEQFPLWLAKTTNKKQIVLIIDGLNQLDSLEDWLPPFIPRSICLFLSTLPEESPLASELKCTYWSLPLLSSDEERGSFITLYLQQYGILPCPQTHDLLIGSKIVHPLYLKIILEAWLLCDNLWEGEHYLEYYLQAQTLSELYEKLLTHLETHYYPDWIEKILSLLWVARRGIHISELLALLEIPQTLWSELYPVLQSILVNESGLLNFSHDSVRQAVRIRYLSDEKKRILHRQLADYFEQQPLSSRQVNELPYHLKQALEPVRLHAYISQIPVFLQLMKEDKEYELWSYWLWIGTAFIVEAYQERLAVFEKTVPQDEDLASGLDKIATFFQTKAYYKATFLLFRQALHIRQKIFGVKHPLIARSLIHLALLLKITGDYEKAEQLVDRALQIYEKVLGTEHSETVDALNHLASLVQLQGDYEEAELLYREVLKIRENVLGTEHSLTVQSMNNLALLLQEQGQYDNAKILYQNALKIRKNVLGWAHFDTVQSINNLALLFQHQGQYQRAEWLYRKAFKLREQLLDINHPATVSSLNSLALLLADKGDYKGAEPLYRQALKIREKVLGEEHPNTATSLNNLGLLLQYKGDYEGAEALFRKALKICKKCEGKEHPSTATALNNLALLLKKKGDYEAAESLYRQALKMSEKFKGVGHLSTATALNNLASLLKVKGDYQGAQPLFRRALVIFEQVLGTHHSHTVTVRKNLE